MSDALAVVGFAGDVRDALSGIFDALPDGVHVKVDAACRHTDPRPGRSSYSDRPARRSRRAHRRARRVAGRAAGRLDWLDIRAGEPRITQPAVEQFVPQMVNFDVIGAVNFRKGCYPGQEIVARSQYRGTIKRRTALAHVAGETDTVHAGVELFHSDDPGQPCGMIVNAAAAPAGGVDALVEIKLAALDSGTVHSVRPTARCAQIRYAAVRVADGSVMH